MKYYFFEKFSRNDTTIFNDCKRIFVHFKGLLNANHDMNLTVFFFFEKFLIMTIRYLLHLQMLQYDKLNVKNTTCSSVFCCSTFASTFLTKFKWKMTVQIIFKNRELCTLSSNPHDTSDIIINLFFF